MHKRRQVYSGPQPTWIIEAMASSNDMIDRGIRNGVTEMGRTPGLYVNPMAEHDVLALAFRRALTAGIPLSATLEQILDRLTESAVYTDVRPMATATPAESPALSSSAAAGGGHGDAA